MDRAISKLVQKEMGESEKKVPLKKLSLKMKFQDAKTPKSKALRK